VHPAELSAALARIVQLIAEMREDLTRKQQRLAALDPGSPGYQELEAEIEADSRALDEMHDTEKGFRKLVSGSEKTSRSNASNLRWRGTSMAVGGAVTAVLTAGTTPVMLLGIAVAALGVIMLFMSADQ
jgi:hypothetical protein